MSEDNAPIKSWKDIEFCYQGVMFKFNQPIFTRTKDDNYIMEEAWMDIRCMYQDIFWDKNKPPFEIYHDGWKIDPSSLLRYIHAHDTSDLEFWHMPVETISFLDIKFNCHGKIFTLRQGNTDPYIYRDYLTNEQYALMSLDMWKSGKRKSPFFGISLVAVDEIEEHNYLANHVIWDGWDEYFESHKYISLTQKADEHYNLIDKAISSLKNLTDQDIHIIIDIIASLEKRASEINKC